MLLVVQYVAGSLCRRGHGCKGHRPTCGLRGKSSSHGYRRAKVLERHLIRALLDVLIWVSRTFFGGNGSGYLSRRDSAYGRLRPVDYSVQDFPGSSSSSHYRVRGVGLLRRHLWFLPREVST